MASATRVLVVMAESFSVLKVPKFAIQCTIILIRVLVWVQLSAVVKLRTRREPKMGMRDEARFDFLLIFYFGIERFEWAECLAANAMTRYD